MPEEGGIMFRISLLTTAVVLAAGASAFAQQFPSQPPPVKNSTLQQGTEKERDACHPDVARFCQTQFQVPPNQRPRHSKRPQHQPEQDNPPLSGVAGEPRPIMP